MCCRKCAIEHTIGTYLKLKTEKILPLLCERFNSVLKTAVTIAITDLVGKRMETPMSSVFIWSIIALKCLKSLQKINQINKFEYHFTNLTYKTIRTFKRNSAM